MKLVSHELYDTRYHFVLAPEYRKWEEWEACGAIFKRYEGRSHASVMCFPI